MALRRVPVVVGLVLAIALASNGPIGASTRTHSYGSVSRVQTNALAAVIRTAASSPQITPDDIGGIGASSLCWERDYSDPAGDAPIDAVAYRLTYDCATGTWRLSATLAAPLDPATFDSFAIEIDTDNDSRNGCGGFDFLVAGVFATNGAP
jgi:hypothetical protein